MGMRNRNAAEYWLEKCLEQTCPDDCPYRDSIDVARYPECMEEAVRDLIESIKPRVLTLREIMGDADIAYVQSRHGLVQPCVIDHKESDKTMCTMALGINVPYDHRWDKYGINWRCWSDKPTEEQEEEPWDD